MVIWDNITYYRIAAKLLSKKTGIDPSFGFLNEIVFILADQWAAKLPDIKFEVWKYWSYPAFDLPFSTLKMARKFTTHFFFFAIFFICYAAKKNIKQRSNSGLLYKKNKTFLVSL